MPTREHIIREIRRIAEKNGCPPGQQVFERETGVRKPGWYGIYFARWGDALRAAGYEPNDFQRKFSSEYVLRKFAEVVRHFACVPTTIEIRMYTRNRQDFPGHSTFTNHFGNKTGLVTALAKWVRNNDEFADLVALLPEPNEDASSAPSAEGYVYLLKSGNHYKIGRSEQLERRV